MMAMKQGLISLGLGDLKLEGADAKLLGPATLNSDFTTEITVRSD